MRFVMKRVDEKIVRDMCEMVGCTDDEEAALAEVIESLVDGSLLYSEETVELPAYQLMALCSALDKLGIAVLCKGYNGEYVGEA